MCSRNVRIKCICFALLMVSAFSQEQTKAKIKRFHANLSMTQRSIERVDREILTLTKGIRELQKQQTQMVAAIAKHQQSIKKSQVDVVSKNIAKKIALLQELTSAMENTSQLHAFNERLQVESKKMQRLIQVKKQINSEVFNHQKHIVQYKRQLSEISKKMDISKSVLAKTVRKRKILKKNALIYKKQRNLAAQEYVQQKKQLKKKRLLAAYAAKKKREMAEKKKREAAEKKRREDNERKKRALAYAQRKKKSSRNNIRENPDSEEEAAIASLLLLKTAEDVAEDVADATEDQRKNNKLIPRIVRKQNPKDGAWMTRVGSFWVYEKPITNTQYWETFRGMYYNNAQKNAQAVTEITFRDAQEYARWAGAKLPTYSQLQKLPKNLSGNAWEWTNSTYRKKSAHVIFNKIQKPRLLSDAKEHTQVTFRLILPAR
ncbi:SUMF1/EgtB/PvdO family nonheme iron enzyme [Candidatus Uabimicrobium amorphum]|uniref:Sulfatase-modifying factor enzyme-like domain-containing protein n=1 Tax=Uabimicrobium amorphum TaxID=2596890 RepID=A0A5S9F5Y3_UABAM|nr:SUMF1/EgtB/PvdO family nonheme iron enzyme [Candidatus Uabimicrobium amorphum]BBM87335.1 hypothetical protein UABAM_05744 [Candidatus Uabimicrobium amorphum]